MIPHAQRLEYTRGACIFVYFITSSGVPQLEDMSEGKVTRATLNSYLIPSMPLLSGIPFTLRTWKKQVQGLGWGADMKVYICELWDFDRFCISACPYSPACSYSLAVPCTLAISVWTFWSIDGFRWILVKNYFNYLSERSGARQVEPSLAFYQWGSCVSWHSVQYSG